MATGVKRIIEQDSHRNGVGGASAVITLFEAYGHRGTFVATSVSPYRTDEQRSEEAKMRDFATHTVVLHVGELDKGNIAMAGGNSWRGADHFGMDIARAWRDKCLAGTYAYNPFAED